MESKPKPLSEIGRMFDLVKKEVSKHSVSEDEEEEEEEEEDDDEDSHSPAITGRDER